MLRRCVVERLTHPNIGVECCYKQTGNDKVAGHMTARKGSAIVLDLDETLLYSTTRPVNGKSPDYQYGDLVGYHRPSALDFLRYCRAHFDHVIVFTAGAPNYAMAMIEALQQRSGVSFDYTFDRRACIEETENTGFLEYWNRYAKYLQTLRDRLLPEDVAKTIDWDDTLLLDDLAHNARENLRQAVLMPKFSRRTASPLDADDWLRRVQRFIDAKPDKVKWAQVDKTFWFLY